MNRTIHPSSGFTLIELLTVLAIVSALVAVAVPQYSAYRERAYDARAQSDLRSVAIAEEAYYLDSESYLSCAEQGCEQLPGIRRLSTGVTLAVSATTTGFLGTSSHPSGSGKVFRWDSGAGGLLP